MMNAHPRPEVGRWQRMIAQLGRDFAYVLPGFFISLLGFVVLIPLLALSIPTLIIWIGAVLLPLTLVIATGFAELTRSRLRHWGVDLGPVRYITAERSLTGMMRLMADGQRWRDLVFETVVALPLRIFTFTIAVVWPTAALAGITFFSWVAFLPDDDNSLLGLILHAVSDGSIVLSHGEDLLAKIGTNLVFGIIFLLTLPSVIHGLARLDASVSAAALRQASTPETPEVPEASEASQAASRRVASPGAQLSSVKGWAWLVAGFTAVAMLAVNWPVLAAVHHVHVALAMVLALAHSVGLLLVVRWPNAGIILGTAAAFATAFATAPVLGLPWPWPVTTMITQLLLVILVSLWCRWQLTVIVWIISVASSAIALVVMRSEGFGGALSNAIVFASVAAGLAILGAIGQQLQSSHSALQAERHSREEQDEKQRELQERNRIAQELHDVVAHSMSVISVQATTAPYRLADVDETTADEFSSIARSSRRALNEMRGLLSVLRGSEEVPLTAQPGPSDLPDLVETTRNSGAQVELHLVPDAHTPAVPTTTGLTIYRIVQEALGNAVRHSPGSAISVNVTTQSDVVEIQVVNGPPDEVSALGPAPGAGLGLPGVQRRAEALGGTVQAGPTSDGGFSVQATVPLA